MIGAPPPTGYSYILYPPSNPFFSKEFNLTGFVDVWSPTDYFNGGPRPLESTHMLPIDWKFDANGVVMPATEGEYVYKETDTACGDCGQMLTYNT